MMNEGELIAKINSLDYCDLVAIKCGGSEPFISSYADSSKQNDQRALDYLKTIPQLTFLLDSRSLLFYTTMTDERTALSYEYKLCRYSARSQITKKLSRIWSNCPAYPLVDYYAKTHVYKGLRTSGIYFFGIEYAQNCELSFDKAKLKIYFKTYWDGENGVFFNSPYFNDYISKCGQAEFVRLSEISSQLVDAKAEVYLISWNWDKKNNNCAYKIYFLINENTNVDKMSEILRQNDCCPDDQIEFATSKQVMSQLRLSGLAICLDSNAHMRTNFYYKQL